MLISPVKAIESGWVSGEYEPSDVSPNGIDFRLQRLFSPDPKSTNSFIIRKDDSKQHRVYTEVLPYHIDTQDLFGWRLNSNNSYDFTSNLSVRLPNNVAALIIQRSTLNRNSMMITSGLWDSGFKGNVSGQLRNNASQEAYIEKDVRIGQIIFMEAQSAYAYHGQYQSTFEHWAKNNEN